MLRPHLARCTSPSGEPGTSPFAREGTRMSRSILGVTRRLRHLPPCSFSPAFSLTLARAHSTSASPPTSSAKETPKDIFQAHRFVRTVEICPSPDGPWSLLPGGEAAGEKLLESKNFHATVRPDLPNVASLGAAVNRLLPGVPPRARAEPKPVEFGSAVNSGSSDARSSSVDAGGGSSGAWEVRTVAAQTRGMPELEAAIRIRAALVCSTQGSGQKSGALLFLSGGHPLRSVPLLKALMPADSTKMLRAARDMRDKGELPSGLQLWAVENPNSNLKRSLANLRRKLDAGAEAFLLQPPLLPEAFAEWWAAADSQGLTSACRLVVGVPVISSSRNLRFWMFLAKCRGPEAESEVARFARAEAEAEGDKGALERLRQEWTQAYMKQARDLPGAAGMHVMPVSPRGWKDLSSLVSQGNLI